jgi:hypothetical protein
LERITAKLEHETYLAYTPTIYDTDDAEEREWAWQLATRCVCRCCNKPWPCTTPGCPVGETLKEGT